MTVATAAAKEAATTLANAPDAETGMSRAIETVATAATNHGLPPGSMTVEFSGDWCRACTVTASVTVDIPAVADTGFSIDGPVIDRGCYEHQPEVVTPGCSGDVTGDHVVDFADLNELLENWGTMCP